MKSKPYTLLEIFSVFSTKKTPFTFSNLKVSDVINIINLLKIGELLSCRLKRCIMMRTYRYVACVHLMKGYGFDSVVLFALESVTGIRSL